jgi:N-acetylglucosaminyldiphosphoundecaprenol N-acetyl-beta-D-mannosaminyltransferase
MRPEPLPPELDFPRANVLGVGVHAIDLAQAVSCILASVQIGRKGYVCVTGAHGIIEAHRDESFRRILNGSLLTTPDGMPTVWMGRSQGFDGMQRVYGPDLMLALCGATAGTPITHFLYGGADGSADLLARSLSTRFPGLKMVGTYTPPFRALEDEESAELERIVRAANPDIFWVGIGAPKQERFMAAYLSRLDTRVMIGVGAAFDMHLGRKRQAPAWVQRNGLEWLFRLLQEPRRLGPRYLSVIPTFIWRAFLQSSGLRRYELT